MVAAETVRDAMLIAALGGGEWAAIVTAIGVALSGLLTSLYSMYLANRREAAAIAREEAKAERDRQTAEKVEEVRRQAVKAATKVDVVAEKLDTSTTATGRKLDSIIKTGEATHDLCNSAMGEQKRIYAVKCRAMAIATPTPANLAEAEAAERAHREHEEKQAKTDVKASARDRGAA